MFIEELLAGLGFLVYGFHHVLINFSNSFCLLLLDLIDAPVQLDVEFLDQCIVIFHGFLLSLVDLIVSNTAHFRVETVLLLKDSPSHSPRTELFSLDFCQLVLKYDTLTTEVLDLVVELVQCLVLDAFLILQVLEAARHEVVEDSLRLVDHVLVEAVLLVELEEVHVGHLLYTIEIQRALLASVAFHYE